MDKLLLLQDVTWEHDPASSQDGSGTRIGTVVLAIKRSKANQTGPPEPVALPAMPQDSLQLAAQHAQ